MSIRSQMQIQMVMTRCQTMMKRHSSLLQVCEVWNLDNACFYAVAFLNMALNLEPAPLL